jgi:hypothetical protein
MRKAYGVRRVDTSDCGDIHSQQLVDNLPSYDKAMAARLKLERAPISLPTDWARTRYYITEKGVTDEKQRADGQGPAGTPE